MWHKQISDKAITCPNCGVPINLQIAIPVNFFRPKKMSGALVPIYVYIDTGLAGELKNGGSFTVDILPGSHQIHLEAANGATKSGNINIPADANAGSVEIATGVFGFNIGTVSFK